VQRQGQEPGQRQGTRLARARTSLTTAYKDLQLNVYLESSNDNERAQQMTVIQD